MSFTRSQCIHEGYEADVLELQPARGTSLSCLVLFIPGNPGLPGFYEPFLEHIYASLESRAIISAISQLAHCPASRLPSPSTCPSLDEQIRSKARFIREKQGEHPSLPTVVVGHSLGGWMIAQIMKNHPELSFQSILLFPSLSNMALTPNGLRMRYFLTSPVASIVSQICRLLKLLPSSMILPLVRLVTGHNEQGVKVSAQLASSPATVWSTIVMGEEELARVREPDLITLEKCGKRIRCYWSRVHEDGWTSEADVADIKGAIERGGGVALRCIEGVKHDFCTSDKHSKYMADICAQWIREVL